MERLSRRYAGKYVGLVDGRLVASGKNQLKVFKKAEKGLSKGKEIGIFYIPSKADLPLLVRIK